MLTFNPETHTYAIDGKAVPGVTEIVNRLSPGFNVSDAVITQAARRGTAVHEYCELTDYGALEPEQVEPELTGYVNAYLSFLRDYRPKWAFVEKPLASSSSGFAGTLDRFGFVSGRPTLVDIKTTSNPDRRAKIKLACQLAGYEILCKENCDISGLDCLGLYLTRKGSYTVVSMNKIQERYKFDAVTLFRSLLDIAKIAEGYK